MRVRMNIYIRNRKKWSWWEKLKLKMLKELK